MMRAAHVPCHRVTVSAWERLKRVDVWCALYDAVVKEADVTNFCVCLCDQRTDLLVVLL